MPTPLRSCRPSLWLAALLVACASGAGVAATADHLLLSEVNLFTRVTISPPLKASEFVELVNPTGAVIDLSRVYLTDATFNSPPTYYYNIVKLGGTDIGAGGGTGGDFHARFPNGATIAPGDTIVVAIAGSAGYLDAYGRLPDYELYEDGIAPDAVPELVEAFPGSIGRGLGTANANTPDLYDSGETLVLYTWDGQGDLVRDLDYIIWGSSSLTSVRVSKTGVALDGPDAGTETTAYQPDTDITAQRTIASTHTFGLSFKRDSFDEETETGTGGNGLTGHNETSEPLNTSWNATSAQAPPLAPPPEDVTPPAPIVTAATLSPVAPYAGQAAVATATALAYDGVATVTLHWSDDGGATFTDVTCASAGTNAWSGDIPGRPEGTTVRWYVSATALNGASATRPVAAPIYANSYVVGAAPDYPPLLLLSEVCVAGNAQEFIEIANPNGVEVDLSNYYLTDAIYATLSQYYWRIVQGSPSQTTIGGGAYTDFHARFPDGARIPARGVITVSVAGSDAFTGAYGFAPDYELYEDGAAPDDVPDMREVFTGSIDGSTLPTLSNAGEIVVLYYWNGASDLVFDIDVFVWGTDTSFRFSKTGVIIDGPDAGTTGTAYQPDTAVGSQRSMTATHAAGESYDRIDAAEATETLTGGNGTLGHDETSEDWATAFAVHPSSPGIWDVNAPVGAGQLELVVPARTFLPARGELFPIRFRSTAGYQTRLRIFDLTGRLVITLYDVDSGSQSLLLRNWDGRDSTYELVPAGMYIAHLSAVDPRTGKAESKTAPVVVATRLGQ